jgi:uncharacterized protein YbgA (DUF1722 family)
MAILKVGDWVLVEGEGVGKITLIDFHPKYHLVWLLDSESKFAVLRSEHLMTFIDPAFHKLLTDVYKESDDEKISNKPT